MFKIDLQNKTIHYLIIGVYLCVRSMQRYCNSVNQNDSRIQLSKLCANKMLV